MRALLLVFTLLGANEEYSRFITAASRLFENLEYERALDQLGNAKKFAKTADEQTEVALYEGVVLLELGRSDEAKAALQTALYLSPDARVPVKVSPKVLAQVEAVRAQVKKELAPILEKRAEEERKRRAAEEAAKAARVEPPPPPPPKTEPKVEPRPPPNAVVKKDTPQVEAPPPKLEPQPEPAPQAVTITGEPAPKKKGVPIVALLFTGGAAGSAIAASVFGTQSQRQVQLAHDAEFQNEADQYLSEARQKALYANILFGVTGALAVAALISAIVWAASE